MKFQQLEDDGDLEIDVQNDDVPSGAHSASNGRLKVSLYFFPAILTVWPFCIAQLHYSKNLTKRTLYNQMQARSEEELKEESFDISSLNLR